MPTSRAMQGFLAGLKLVVMSLIIHDEDAKVGLALFSKLARATIIQKFCARCTLSTRSPSLYTLISQTKLLIAKDVDVQTPVFPSACVGP